MIPFGFLKGRSDTVELYDDADVVYSLHRPAMSTLWTNAVAKIRRSSDSATAYLFFDGSSIEDTISTSSFISTSSNTTPSATTLSSWLSTDDFYYEEWIGITPDNIIDTNKIVSQTTTSLQPKGGTAGAIITKNSKPDIDFTSTKTYFEGTANSVFDSGNTYSLFTVSYSNTSGAQSILSTAATTGSNSARLQLRGDRTNLRLIIIRDTAGTNYFSDYLALHDVADQRALVCVNDGSDIIGYYNGTIQETTAWSNTYVNDTLQFGVDRTNSHQLNGGIQFIALFDSDKSSEMSGLQDDINNYFSIY